MTDNKHAYIKHLSECKCRYQSIYITNEIDNKMLRIKVKNHGDPKDNEEGWHDIADIEISYAEFTDMMKKIGLMN